VLGQQVGPTHIAAKSPKHHQIKPEKSSTRKQSTYISDESNLSVASTVCAAASL